MHKGENGIVELVTVRLKGVGRLEREEFCRRLTQLRMNKGVSARDMSLSIGQSPNYIRGIEAGENYPSMATFFYICDYLEITRVSFSIRIPPIPQRPQSCWNLRNHFRMISWIF